MSEIDKKIEDIIRNAEYDMLLVTEAQEHLMIREDRIAIRKLVSSTKKLIDQLKACRERVQELDRVTDELTDWIDAYRKNWGQIEQRTKEAVFIAVEKLLAKYDWFSPELKQAIYNCKTEEATP